MRYRADIDGLRAIAILLVLLYHGGVSLFPSGFIGVDLFFVISGYLITGIIHESYIASSFSLIAFYNRRLWRLQPVFICFLLATTLCTLLFFLPDDLMDFSRSARKSSLFIANYFFNRTTTGYFSPDTQQLPLLHTWSLSIEWQCYLILPLLMYALHRLIPQRHMITTIGLLTLLSWFASRYYSQTMPAQSYYQFSGRIFEFLIGSCVALIPEKDYLLNKLVLPWLCLGALVTLFYVAMHDSILIGYPDYYALAVCIAGGVLIMAGRFYPQQFWIKVLSLRPLVFIGLLSYSLYIWHWPVFALLRYYSIKETMPVLLLVYGITLILAYLSWRYIELPARRLNRIKFSYTLMSLFIAPILFTHSISYLIHQHSGFPQRFNSELVTIYRKLEQYKNAERPLCISNNNTNIETHCSIGAKNTPAKTGLLIGDSHSNHYWGFIDTLAKAADIRILAQGTSACLALPGLYLYDWWHFKNSVYQECFDQTQRYVQLIKKGHYDYVIIGERWSNYLRDNIINELGDKRSLTLAKQRIERALNQALEIIIDSGATPVLIKTTAMMNTDIHSCVYQHIKKHRVYDASECTFALRNSSREQWFIELFKRMKAKYPQLILIDPRKIQCPAQRCKAEIDGVPVYRDKEHISDYASYRWGELYLQQFGNPFGVRVQPDDRL